MAERLLLTGHSHQAWPDVALEGLTEAFADAALAVDDKWGRAFAKADRLRAGYRDLLGEPDAEIALGASTHDLLIRLLSALPLRAKPRLVTTDGEFHTARRQFARLAEAGVEVVRIPAGEPETLAERLAAAVDPSTCAVLVSAVLFETSRIVPDLDVLARACARHGAELVVDAYHALGVVPFSVPGQGLTDAWVLGGGYKYLQLGEGNCFLRLPGHADELRPVVTGWFAEFADLADEPDPDRVAYGSGAVRFAGSTYDPVSNYRGARVLDFFAEQGLTAARLREISLRQNAVLAQAFDALDLPDTVITRDRAAPREAFGGFLALRAPEAARWQRQLAERGVLTDSRGEHLRFGPAPYLADRQLTDAMAALGEEIRAG